MLNALPKIALGPVFIVWVGAGTQAIIVMALAISLIVTVLEMLNGFLSTDEEMITMARYLWRGSPAGIYQSSDALQSAHAF